MILIDCGNRAFKLQHWSESEMSASYVSSYDRHWAEDFADWLARMSASQCFLVSVLDQSLQLEMDNCLANRFGSSVTRFVSQAESLGIINGYTEPEKLGVDRWLALIAAAEIVEADAIVIDAGSAITIDLLDRTGRHLGGAILPGMYTSMEKFRQIFHYIDFNDPAIAQFEDPGSSTEAAIQIDYGLNSIKALPELVDRWRKRFDAEPSVILAGADAAQVQQVLEIPSRIVPDLIFRGMRRLIKQ